MATYDQSKLATVSPDDRRSSTSSEKLQNDPAKLKDPADAEHRLGVQSDSEGETVGRQIEMEAENTIKYRTCSWQKVCCGFCIEGKDLRAKIIAIDGCPALLRVYLSGYHVIPVVLFHSGTGPGFDLDCLYCCGCPLHVPDNLVCIPLVPANFSFLLLGMSVLFPRTQANSR